MFEKYIKIGNYLYLIVPSKKKDKKYDVYYVLFSKENKDLPKEYKNFTMEGLNKDERYKKYIVSFGDKNYEHYEDKIGYYKNLDHKDNKRRKLYKERHKKDNINDPKYAGFWSWNYLW
jgi:hypothetical protein